MKKVLFVDDESYVLKVIERKFEPTKIKCFFTSSIDEAFELIRQHDMDVIVADIQMPKLSGIEFFKRIRKISPRSVRITLSGYSRTASIIDAINEGHIYKYIQKPWKIDDEAIEVIEEAIAVSRKWRSEDEMNVLIDMRDLSKLNGMENYVLLNSLNELIYENSDYPRPSDYKEMPSKVVRSNIGELKLIDLGR